MSEIKLCVQNSEGKVTHPFLFFWDSSVFDVSQNILNWDKEIGVIEPQVEKNN